MQTWYEILWNNWEIDIKRTIENVQAFLSRRRPEKYEDFLKKLNKTKILFTVIWLPHIEERVLLIKYIYYAMRILDDICDWDTPNKVDDESKKESIIIAINSMWNNWSSINKNILRLLLEEIEKLSRIVWIEMWIKDSILQIILSIWFDIERILEVSWWKIVAKKDLEENFHKMDIEWTIWWTALIFWIDLEKTKLLLRELWEATRIWYTLEDLKSDIDAWIINIPKEDLDEFWITIEDLKRFSKEWYLSNGLKKWIKKQIEKIDNFLEIHKNKMEENNFEITFWNWGIFDRLRQRVYNFIIKTKVLSWYITETLNTRTKVLNLIN